MKVCKFIKLFLIIFPIAIIVGLWAAFCAILEHIIEEYRVK